mmetsp:Transcript_39204/g.61110  ORF Transcript_39204/g.61110 Transcript_39204/m.61110 type:complete len:212 (-) Transcript_39204:492-1127(-)
MSAASTSPSSLCAGVKSVKNVARSTEGRRKTEVVSWLKWGPISRVRIEAIDKAAIGLLGATSAFTPSNSAVVDSFHFFPLESISRMSGFVWSMTVDETPPTKPIVEFNTFPPPLLTERGISLQTCPAWLRDCITISPELPILVSKGCVEFCMPCSTLEPPLPIDRGISWQTCPAWLRECITISPELPILVISGCVLSWIECSILEPPLLID